MSGKRTMKAPLLALWMGTLVSGMWLSTTASAAEQTRPFIMAGLAFGGDTLVDTTGSDLDAGGLLYFGGGIIHEPFNSNLMYQFSIGYKFDSVDFSGPSGDSSVRVVPVDAMAFYKVDRLRFGAGLTYYMNPKWELCFDFSGCATANFDDAMGVAFELRHQWTDIMFWGARYTNVEYEWGSSTADASNLRIHFGMMF